MFKLFYWHNSTVLHQSNVHLHVYPPIYFNAGSYTIFFCLLNPMCQVYLALLYIVYVYLTLLSVYIFRIKLLMLCLYTYAYCIYRCCIFYGFVYLPSETNTVSQGWKALPWFSVFYFSLYEVFMNLVLNCRTHIVNTQGYWCAMSAIVWLL